MREDWTETTLGEIANLYQPKTIAKTFMDKNAEYIVFGANGAIGRYHEFNHADPEVVVTCRGATCGTVNMTPRNTWITGNAMVIQPKNRELDKQFLYYSLIGIVDIYSIISGSAQPQITKEGLFPVKISVPPLQEQERIVDLIASVDSYIEALQQQVESAKKSRNALLHHLLSAGGDDWVESTLGELISYSIGGIWGEEIGRSDFDIPVFRQTEFSDSGILKTPANAFRSISKSQLHSRALKYGDILIQKSAGTPTLPGRVVMVPDLGSEVATFSNFLNLLRPYENKCISRFAFLWFWHKHTSGRAFLYQRGTNIRNLDLPNYLQEKILLPPLQEQNRIVDLISSLDDGISATEKLIVDTKHLRSGLLSELLSGDHEIPDSYHKVLGAA